MYECLNCGNETHTASARIHVILIFHLFDKLFTPANLPLLWEEVLGKLQPRELASWRVLGGDLPSTR